MSISRKAVIVRRFSRDWFSGYARPYFGQDAEELEVLDTTGKVIRVPWEAVKWVCYVRDLPSPAADQLNPERLLHKRFTVRPRTSGLWIRVTLADGDELEGLAANDRSLIDGSGISLTPPDLRSNTQRMYVPRQAITALEVVAMIGDPARRAGRQTSSPVVKQPELFPGEEE